MRKISLTKLLQAKLALPLSTAKGVVDDLFEVHVVKLAVPANVNLEGRDGESLGERYLGARALLPELSETGPEFTWVRSFMGGVAPGSTRERSREARGTRRAQDEACERPPR